MKRDESFASQTKQVKLMIMNPKNKSEDSNNNKEGMFVINVCQMIARTMKWLSSADIGR